MGTHSLLELFTVTVAQQLTLFTHYCQRVLTIIRPTYLFPFTDFSILTCIMWIKTVASVLLHRMIPHSLGNGYPVPQAFF